jgi:SH3-like domain-containing protein
MHREARGKRVATVPFRHHARRQSRASTWVLAVIAGTLAGTPLLAQSPQPLGIGPTGLPLPRFVSLKADRVQVRQGPGTDHKILWVFNRVGLPVEVIQEHENWRQVRDQDGSVGWVAHALLSARRTAVVMAWATGEARTGAAKPVPLFDESSTSARQVALLEPGVICGIRRCDGRWCQISVGDYRGYVEQTKLWGVYPGENIR